jgi:hypothetical protein
MFPIFPMHWHLSHHTYNVCDVILYSKFFECPFEEDTFFFLFYDLALAQIFEKGGESIKKEKRKRLFRKPISLFGGQEGES